MVHMTWEWRAWSSLADSPTTQAAVTRWAGTSGMQNSDLVGSQHPGPIHGSTALDTARGRTPCLPHPLSLMIGPQFPLPPGDRKLSTAS